MAGKKSPIRWIIGTIAVLVVAGCVGGLVVGIPKLISGVGSIKDYIADAVKTEQERTAFAESWGAPADDVPPGELFPSSVGDFTLASHDENAAVVDLGLDVPGRHAVYESSGGSEVEVFAYRASSLERELLYQRVLKALKEESYNHKWTQGDETTDRLAFKISPPLQKGYLWWARKWLFFFRVEAKETEIWPFAGDYLTAIQPEEPTL